MTARPSPCTDAGAAGWTLVSAVLGPSMAVMDGTVVTGRRPEPFSKGSTP